MSKEGDRKVKTFKTIRDIIDEEVFKTEINEKVGERRPWAKGFNPAEQDQLRRDRKLKKDLETYKKKKPQIKKVKDAEKHIPYLLNHINQNFGDGKGGDISDKKFHQLSNVVMFYYSNLFRESVEEIDEKEVIATAKLKGDIKYKSLGKFGDRNVIELMIVNGQRRAVAIRDFRRTAIILNIEEFEEFQKVMKRIKL